jgi:hypothetical protein
MNVEIGAEAAQFPEKDYINGIALTVYPSRFPSYHSRSSFLTSREMSVKERSSPRKCEIFNKGNINLQSFRKNNGKASTGIAS